MPDYLEQYISIYFFQILHILQEQALGLMNKCLFSGIRELFHMAQFGDLFSS